MFLPFLYLAKLQAAVLQPTVKLQLHLFLYPGLHEIV